jgi:hypothetical protein
LLFAGAVGEHRQEKRDLYFLTDDFFGQGPTAATPRFRVELIEAHGSLTLWPEQLDLHEKPSRETGPRETKVN